MEYLANVLAPVSTPEVSAFAISLVYAMVLPAIWLVFCLWLNQDHPRRSGFLFIAFLLGAFVVIPTLPLETYVATLSNNNTVLTIAWAACEELLKFCVLLFIVSEESTLFNGPRDYPIVAITIGLGFAGLENALYIFHPVLAQNLSQAALSGSMRFLGANLLHAVTVSMSGLALGFAYFQSRSKKIWFLCLGIIVAVCIHSIFNLLLVNANQTQLLEAFGFLWGCALLSGGLWMHIGTMEGTTFIKDVWTRSLEENEDIFNALISKMHVSSDDMIPFRDIFLGPEGEALTAADRTSFDALCDFLKKSYALRLERSGMKQSDSLVASAHLISPDVSPKTIKNVFALLKENERTFMLGQSKIEVH